MNQQRGLWPNLSFVFAFVVAVGTSGNDNRAHAAEPLRVAVVQSQESRGPSDSLKTIQLTVAQALSDAGVETVPAGRIPKDASGCRGAACAQMVDAHTDATHAFVVRAQYANEAFNMVIEVWSTASKTLVASEARDCAICDLKDFERAAHALTVALIPRIPPASSAGVEPPTAAAQATTALAPQREQPLMTIARWVGLGVGVAMVGVGAYYLSKDGDPSCRAGETPPCDRVHDTKVGALTLMTAGVLVGGAAVILPMVLEGERQTPLAGLGIVGRF